MLVHSLHCHHTDTLNTVRQNQYDEMMKSHVSKISRLLSKKFDVNEHISIISSYLRKACSFLRDNEILSASKSRSS